MMAGSALLTLYRSLTRHRLYAILNIGGLALGLAVFLVLFLYVRYEHDYDRMLPGADHLWTVNTRYDIPGFPAVNIWVPSDMLAQLQGDFAGLQGARFRSIHDAIVRNGQMLTSEDVAEVDPAYFKFFPVPAIAGDPAKALAQPDAAVVTREIADRYLGEGPALGKSLTLSFEGETHSYRVAAVLKSLPSNMTYASGIFLPLPAPGSADAATDGQSTLFLHFPDSAAAHAFDKRLPAFVDRHPPDGITGDPGKKASSFYKVSLIPLTAVHLIEPRDRAIVTTLGVVGLLVLLIAIVNYVNLATARAGLRAREVALRKVLGGTRRSLVVQFLLEALATTALAALIALAIAEVTLPFVNAIGGISLGIDYFGRHSVLIPLILMILVVGSIAGLYPALVLSRFRPAAVLAAARSPGGGKAGARLRQALVVLQFAIAIAFSIGTAVLLAQTAHMRSADLGFRRDGLILVTSFLDAGVDQAQRADLLRAFAATPGVGSVGLSEAVPGGGSYRISSYENNGHTINIDEVTTGPGFFTTYGAHLLAGRLFDAAHPGDDRGHMSDEELAAHPRNVVISASAAKTFGYTSPAGAIGKPAKFVGQKPPTIIGVVADMRFTSPREAVQPVLYRYNSANVATMVPAIRTSPDAIPMVSRRLEATWRNIVPGVPFKSTTADQFLYKQFYQNDAQRSRLFTIGAVLAVLIGCIGLYGLASFDTARRVKEIGIRKTLGASTRDIMRLLIGQFLRPVLLANLIAWPLAFFTMRKWLAGFDDRVALSPLFFIAATLVAIGIAAATVFGQAWRVARAEPARALRYE